MQLAHVWNLLEAENLISGVSMLQANRLDK